MDASNEASNRYIEEFALEQVHGGSRVLNLEFSNLRGGEPLGRILQVAATSPTLVDLQLGSNPLGDDGIFALKEFFFSNNTLESLSLYNCSISDAQAVDLCEGLLANSSLLRISLAANGIHSSGGRAVSRVIAKHPCLREVDLRNNHLGDALVDIAESIQKTKTLKILILAETNIQRRGGMELLQALKRPDLSLIAIDLSQNALEFPSTDLIVQALLHNPTLQRIRLTKFDLALKAFLSIVQNQLRRERGSLPRSMSFPQFLRAIERQQDRQRDNTEEQLQMREISKLPVSLMKRMLTQFQQKHFVTHRSMLEWSQAYRRGLALCSPPTKIDYPDIVRSAFSGLTLYYRKIHHDEHLFIKSYAPAVDPTNSLP